MIRLVSTQTSLCRNKEKPKVTKIDKKNERYQHISEQKRKREKEVKKNQLSMHNKVQAPLGSSLQYPFSFVHMLKRNRDLLLVFGHIAR